MIRLPVISGARRPGTRRLPSWLKRPLPAGEEFARTRKVVSASAVSTVCREARCPNVGECWSKRHATFMILGSKCTRRCLFCAVTTARPAPPEADEPRRLAEAVAELRLSHVVITAVSRDDLADEGAAHFAACVRAVRRAAPETTIEVLPADFHARRDCIATLLAGGPDLYNHNLETVERLTPTVRPQADFGRSLEVLRVVKSIDPGMLTKSGLMVGLGETGDELLAAFAALRAVGCEVLTIGQYLCPTREGCLPVVKFYTPDEFDELGRSARAMGFVSVSAGPFVRSSYNAAEVFARTGKARTSCK